MLARLGFSVAAHLDCEVVTIDEVLSVGDAAFQRRCFTRIQELRHAGRAILFVTHNLAAVPLLCERSILLDDGHVVAAGTPDDVLSAYRNRGTSIPTTRSAPHAAQIDAVRTHPTLLRPGEPVEVELDLTIFEPLPAPHVMLALGPAGGTTPTAGISSLDAGVELPASGRCQLRCRIEQLPLQPGFYTLLASLLGEPEPGAVEDQHRLALEVEGVPREQATYGHVALPSTWTVS
jgi:lipopolysaccharide transport system ATP-binding protein